MLKFIFNKPPEVLPLCLFGKFSASHFELSHTYSPSDRHWCKTRLRYTPNHHSGGYFL